MPSDLDFIHDLEAAITNVGSDVSWERKVGGVSLTLSPLTVLAQERVTEQITKMEGPTIIAESKRATLSHAVVGIGGIDLRQYRGQAVFPSKSRDGKAVSVTLDRYVYDKIGSWGAQFVDDVFEVYSDLMESFQKSNLKDVKFENAKNPYDELVELEMRVHELRGQLGKPHLVEAGQGGDEEPGDEEPAPQPPPAAPEKFSPFAKVPDGRPVPAPSVEERSAAIAEVDSGLEEAFQRAAEPRPERMDVVDVPAVRQGAVKPPVLDPPPVNRNPRFARG
jgi:hypothetical protein